MEIFVGLSFLNLDVEKISVKIEQTLNLTYNM